MKVLMINSVCGIRSTGRICTDIARILSEEGYECKIAYGREQVPEQYAEIAHRIGNDTDVKIHAAVSRVMDNAGFGSKSVTEKFIKWIEEYDPDIIHMHNLHGYYLNIEVLLNYLEKAGKPVVYTLHDCWSFTGHCAYFDYCGCEKWKTGCDGCTQKGEYPKSVLLDRSKKNYQSKKRLFSKIKNMTIVTPSYWLADIVKESFLGMHEVRVINNGIDTAVFRPIESDFKSRYDLEGKKIILGVASNWDDARKGFGDFRKLSELIDDRHRIVLVGVTEKHMETFPGNITGIKATNSAEELAQIYSAADVFFNPTYEDNYPTVNLEAYACSTPVITYRTGGSVESTAKELVVDKGDLSAVWDMIVHEKYHVDFQMEVDKNKCLREYAELYKELAGMK